MKKAIISTALPILIGQSMLSNASVSDIRWRGFINATAAYSNTEEAYLDRIDNKGDFGDTGIGVNMFAAINPKTTVQGQLFGHDLNDGIVFDWYFVNYRTDGGGSIKVGKIKYPATLLSEIPDIGHSYPWARVPQEIYGHNEAGVVASLESFKGLSYTYSHFIMEGDGELQAIVFAGSSERDEEADPDFNKLAGIRLGAKYDYGEVFVSYATSEIEGGGHHDEDEGEEAGEDEAEEEVSLDEKNNDVVAVGFQWDNGSILSYGEFASISIEDSPELDAETWFLTLGYHFGKWTPHLTFASFEQDTGLEHESTTLGLRYDFTPSVSLKAEYQEVDAKGEPGEEGVFFEEIPDGTADIISVGLNVIF